MSRIARASRLLPGLAVAAFLAVSFFAPSLARAEEKPEDMVKFAVRFEPREVAPGGKGVAVVTGTLPKGLHINADAKLFVVALKPAPGVTYGEVTKVTPPVAWKDPEFPEEPPQDVWFDGFEIRVAFTLAADAAADAHVGAVIRWNGCSSESGQCYFKIDVPFSALVPGLAVKGQPPVAPPAPAPGAPPNPAPAPPAPPAGGCGAPRDAFRFDSTAATVDVWVVAGKVKFCFAPKKGVHLYSPQATESDPILVEGIASEGVAWGAMEFPFSEHEIKAPVEVSLPYKTTGATPVKVQIKVHWQGCEDDGSCYIPENRKPDLELTKDGGKVIPPPPPPLPPPAPPAMAATGPAATAGLPSQGVLFPVVDARGTTAATGTVEKEKTWIQQKWEDLGLLILGPIFLIGLLLAFTPCVLPIIPITVSIIGGGRTDLPRSRLTVLLLTYVAGLAMAFGSLGLVAALTGGSISAAFESPIALWIIAGVFILLAFGMFSIYELQPPQFLQRLQGGAQNRGGSLIGAFLFGALGAVIASPCTGPVIAGMLVFTAQGGNALVGFLMFVTLGLGMGSVFFAAGSLNLIMRPGPWMVWVRYGFGVMLVGVALYYLASSGHLSPTGVFAGGFGIALLVAAGITRHLVKGEGEGFQRAMGRGAKAAALVAIVTGLVAFLTRPIADVAGWVTLRDREHMVAEVEKAKAGGKASVVDVWATWCHYCKAYDEVIESDPELKAGFEKMNRMRVDVTKGQRPDLNDGVGLKRDNQPQLAFLDAEGRVHRAMDIDHWAGGKEAAREWLKERLRTLGVLPTKVAAAGN